MSKFTLTVGVTDFDVLSRDFIESLGDALSSNENIDSVAVSVFICKDNYHLSVPDSILDNQFYIESYKSLFYRLEVVTILPDVPIETQVSKVLTDVYSLLNFNLRIH
jgi:hypothetical protein